MKALLFAVNRNQRRYFQFLAAHFQGRAEVIHARRALRPAWRALKYLDRSSLPPLIERKLTELTARNRARHFWSRFFYRHLFYLLAIVAYLRYRQVIVASGASVLAVWNGYFFRQAIACLVAEQLGIRCVFFENGLLPDTTTLDPRGVNFANSVPREPAFFAARPPSKGLPKNLVPRAARIPARFAATNEPLPHRYVFVPFQIDHDTQITRFSPWIRSMEQFFAEVTAAFAREVPGCHLVFKEHPSAAKRYPEIYRRIEQSPHLHLMNGIATQVLVEKAAAVVVINSTVGLEALLYGKKVIVLGQAFYAMDGIARQAGDRQQLAEAVRQIDSWRVDRELIKRFLAYLHNEYAIPGSWKNPHIQHAAAVEERLGVYHGQNARDLHGVNAPAPV